MNRVVITGVGIVSSIGVGKDEYWENVLQGKCGTADIESFDTSDFENQRGGEIKNFDPGPYLTDQEINEYERTSQLAISASRLALSDAGLESPPENTSRLGVSMGTTLGGITALEKLDKIWVSEGQSKIPYKLLRQYSSGNITANVSQALGFSGYNIMLPNACTAGNFAIGYGFDLLRSETADMMLAGGADSFSWIAFTGFNCLRSVSPDYVSPFDENTKGMMTGEGAAMLVLERLDSALERGAHIYAEIMGYGISCDAYHITAPHPKSRGLITAINKALKNSNLKPTQIDSIIAHGTGTPSNDIAELQAISNVFHEKLDDLPVTALKSMLGHTLGASSAIEALTNALVVSNNRIPPTINYKTPRTDFNVQVVGNKYLEKEIQFGMNNALAFGGNNSSLILGKYPRG